MVSFEQNNGGPECVELLVKEYGLVPIFTRLFSGE